jgi:hypothetical protein
MKTDEQLKTIAEACGYSHVAITSNAPLRAVGCLPGVKGVLPIPDYLGDLNASHEMEKALTPDQFHDYRGSLWKITTAHLSDKPAAWIKVAERAYLTATAPQRAEAFLRALGLWTEPPTTPAHE